MGGRAADGEHVWGAASHSPRSETVSSDPMHFDGAKLTRSLAGRPSAFDATRTAGNRMRICFQESFPTLHV